MAEQFTATKGPAARALRPWMCRAISSLPVPLSPNNKTVALDGAAWLLTSVFYFYQYSMRSAPAVMVPPGC